jgi:SAM-dependent methyltransferase
MSEPDRYLHGHHDSVLRSHRWRTVENSAAYLLPELKPTTRLLDVGCGPGTITADLAQRLPDGLVVGVDASASVLEGAVVSFPDVSFLAGDLFDLPFPDASFDVVHLHQVLQHLSDPVGAMVALRRLIAPGGVLAARDADYGAMTWSPASAGLEGWLELYEACGRAVGGEPDAGRHLARWAEEAGFSEVTTSSSSWVYATADERAWWGSLWADRALGSGFADVALDKGLASRVELEEIAAAWRDFAEAPEGEFVVPHGEVLCRVP